LVMTVEPPWQSGTSGPQEVTVYTEVV
jgi:hypothetical protein